MMDSKQIAAVLFPIAFGSSPSADTKLDLDGVLAHLLVKGYDVEIKVTARDRDAGGHPTRQGRMTLVIES